MIVIILRRFGSSMTQLEIHIEIRMNENSLIGISVIHAKKLFFFTCQINFNNRIVMRGLHIITRNKPVQTKNQLISHENDRLDQSNTK
jgi:hypothetical protein